MIRKQFDIKIIEQKEDGGRILISTNVVDRDGDRVFPDGMIIDNYIKNPVVQWAHNYRDPWATIGRTVSLRLSDDGSGIEAEFELRPPANEHDPQNIIRLLWRGGWIRAASIGFDPVVAEHNEHDGLDYVRWELLEWSLVPIPANQEALRLAVKGLGLIDGQEQGEMEAQLKRVIPYADHGTAEGEWSKPRLSDFTDQPMSELSAEERRRIAAHYTYSVNYPPETFQDLKLPHHRPQRSGVGPAVWNGVRAAMAALLGARGGVDIPDADRRGAYNHLARHYRQFDKEPPEFRAYEEDELLALFGDLPVLKANDNESTEPQPEAGDGADDERLAEALDMLAETIQDLKELLEV